MCFWGLFLCFLGVLLFARHRDFFWRVTFFWPTTPKQGTSALGAVVLCFPAFSQQQKNGPICFFHSPGKKANKRTARATSAICGVVLLVNWSWIAGGTSRPGCLSTDRGAGRRLFRRRPRCHVQPEVVIHAHHRTSNNTKHEASKNTPRRGFAISSLATP